MMMRVEGRVDREDDGVLKRLAREGGVRGDSCARQALDIGRD